MQEQLGMALPPQTDESGEPMLMPPEVEARLAPMLAQAATQLLAKNQAQAAQQQAQQQAQDPLLQIQMQELQLKAQEQQRKAAKDQADAALKAAQLQVERERITEQSRISSTGQQIQAVKAVAELENDRKKEMTKAGLDVLKTMMAARQQPTKGNQ